VVKFLTIIIMTAYIELALCIREKRGGVDTDAATLLFCG